MGIFNRLFGGNKKNADSITVQQILDVFSYGEKENLIGMNFPSGEHTKTGSNVSWEPRPYFYKGYKNIPPQNVPAHIKFHTNSFFAFIGIADGKVEYRHSEDGGSAYFICPITTDENKIVSITSIFNAFYRSLNLQQEVPQLEKPIGEANRRDKILLISNYLHTESDVDFKILTEENDIVFWVDWREDDSAIIAYCESNLETHSLSYQLNNSSDDIGFELFIDFNNIKHKIPYSDKGADRDTTLITLNEMIKPKFEIRLCKGSDGGDTLAFLPLTASQWLSLEEEFGADKVEKHFAIITNKSIMFG